MVFLLMLSSNIKHTFCIFTLKISSFLFTLVVASWLAASPGANQVGCPAHLFVAEPHSGLFHRSWSCDYSAPPYLYREWFLSPGWHVIGKGWIFFTLDNHRHHHHHLLGWLKPYYKLILKIFAKKNQKIKIILLNEEIILKNCHPFSNSTNNPEWQYYSHFTTEKTAVRRR